MRGRLGWGAGLALAIALGSMAAATAEPAAEPAEPDWNAAREETARLLSALVQIDTTNPPGRELPAAARLHDWLATRGVPARVIVSAPGRGNLLARLPATRPDGSGPLLLLAHLDVVPADPEAWTFPPFSGAIRDGFVYGRGTLDDKGQVAIFAEALALLARSRAPRSRDLVFAATAGEEVDGHGARFLIEHHWEALGPPSAVWNEGGAAAPVELLGGRVLAGIATTEKRALWLRLMVEGEGGHGSQPIPDAASDVLVRALARVSAHRTPLHVTPSVAETFARAATALDPPGRWLLGNLGNPLLRRLAAGRLTSNRLTNAMLRDTIALTGLRAGLKHNLIPRRAEALLDVRLLPDSDAEAFLAGLRRVIDDPRVVILHEGPLPGTVPASPFAHELFRTLEDELARELPEAISAPLQTTGSTDSLFFRERGVPAYGFLPAVLGDELNASVHGVDERMPLVELERAVRVSWRVLRRLTRPEAPPDAP